MNYFHIRSLSLKEGLNFHRFRSRARFRGDLPQISTGNVGRIGQPGSIKLEVKRKPLRRRPGVPTSDPLRLRFQITVENQNDEDAPFYTLTQECLSMHTADLCTLPSVSEGLLDETRAGMLYEDTFRLKVVVFRL